jgi:prepilin-type N-terminal cleavage/methylation domain-containing protein
MKTRNLKGFTLIELLVVIAIIAILAAILFPVFAQARTAAKKTATVAAMKQQALSVIMYSDDNDDIVPPRSRWEGFTAPAGQRFYTWERLVQPYTKNWQIFMSSEDSRPKYNAPFAQGYRRSFAGAANMFITEQDTTANTTTTSAKKPSRTLSGVPQPADTILLGMKFMNHRTIANYWDDKTWGNEAVIFNTRSANMPLSDIRAPHGEIQNVYGGSSVWAYSDGHVKVIRAGGYATNLLTGMQNNVHGTVLPGYEQRAAYWVATFLPAWDGGISCLDAEPIVDSSQNDCKLPGE